MKVVSTDALTKLIQLVKSAFISVDDTVQTSEVELLDIVASKDLSNATTGSFENVVAQAQASGKETVTNWSFPSDTYDDLTLGATGTEYTASYNGWFTLTKVTSGNGQYVAMENQTTGLGYTIIGYGAYNGLRISIPCRKGDKVIVGYNAGGATATFRFVRAVGG